VKKRIVFAVVLSVLLAASAYAQTTDFFELVKTGTPQDVRAAVSKGVDLTARDTDGGTPLMVAAADNMAALTPQIAFIRW
jgi:ankyrin repeat protein